MRKAFTLSEALVTLAIIGVLAAILIPVINNVRPDKDKIAYKKAIYSLSNAVSNAMDSAYTGGGYGADFGAGANWGASADWSSPGQAGWGIYGPGGANVSGFNWYGSGTPGYSGVTPGQPGSGDGSGDPNSPASQNSQSFCKTIADSLNTIGSVRCDGPWPGCDGEGSCYKTPNFVTSDGIRYWGLEDTIPFVKQNDEKYGSKIIYVDREVRSSERSASTFRRDVSNSDKLGLKIKIRSDGKVYTDGDYTYENKLIEESLSLKKDS